jgi:hypothetical protein
MAFNSTNKIRSVVVGEFEDKMSQETAKAGANVNATLKRMERQTKEATSGFESLEKTMKALGAAFVLQQGMQAASALVGYAREHNTQATSLVEKLDQTISRTMSIVTNSEAFKAAISGTIVFIEKINELLGNVTDNVLDRAKLEVDLNKTQSNYVAKQLESKELTGEQRDALFEQQKLWNNSLALSKDNLEVLKGQKAAQDAGTTSKSDQKVIELDLYEITKARMELELSSAGKRVAYAQQMLDYAKKHKQIVASGPKPTLFGNAPEIPGGLPDTPVVNNGPAKNSDIFGGGFIPDLTEARDQYKEFFGRDMTTFGEAASQTAEIISNGIGGAFESMGAAIANGQSALGAFGKALIGVAGQIAGAFGDMFIKMGIGAILINPAQGLALIAAGAALKVLAGFLGAKASAGSTSGSSGGSASAPRDYSSDRPSAGKKTGDTYVTVHLNGDVMTFDNVDTNKRFNEWALKIGKSINRQTNDLDRGFV